MSDEEKAVPDEEEEEVDHWLSGVVHLQLPAPAGEAAPAAVAPVEVPGGVPEGVDVDPEAAAAEAGARELRVPVAVAQVARTKGFFTSAGFEVHAPVGSTFSIAGRRSLFERFFGTRLVVDEGEVGQAVRTADGSELSLDGLSEEFRPLVREITFPPPPSLPGA